MTRRNERFCRHGAPLKANPSAGLYFNQRIYFIVRLYFRKSEHPLTTTLPNKTFLTKRIVSTKNKQKTKTTKQTKKQTKTQTKTKQENKRNTNDFVDQIYIYTNIEKNVRSSRFHDLVYS